jgi:hypothetical protein
MSTERTLVVALESRMGRFPTYLPSICFHARRKSSGSEKARKAYFDCREEGDRARPSDEWNERKNGSKEIEEEEGR